MNKETNIKFGLVFLLEHVLFLILIVLGIVFFKERLFTDSGYYFFHVVNSENFRVEHFRFILAFSQILPLIGLKLGFGLKTIAIMYSLNHILFFYFAYLLSKFYLKIDYSGLVFIGIQTIGTAASFFVPMFELMYLSVFIFFIVYILNKKESLPNVLAYSILISFAEFSHFYSTFIIGSYLIFHLLESKKKQWKFFLAFVIISLLVFLIKQVYQSEYDAGKTLAFINNLKSAKYDLNYLLGLVVFLFEFYKELILMFLTMIFVLLSDKRYFGIIWISLAISLMLIMVNLSYYGFEPSRYQEQVYLPLVIISTLFFARIVLGNNNKIKSIFGITLFIILISSRLGVIYKASDEFTKRTKEIESLIEKGKNLNASKLVVSNSELINKSNWSYPVESLLLSAMNYNSNQCITICTFEDIDFENNRSKLKPDNFLFRRWEIMDDNSLNPEYFKISHVNYQLLKP